MANQMTTTTNQNQGEKIMKIEIDILNSTSQMTKMNNKTHKAIVCEYTTYQYFAVPIDWNVEDCSVKYNTLYHKDEEVDGVVQDEIDSKYPNKIKEEKLSDYDIYFSCDEDSDEEDYGLCSRKE